MQLIILLAGTFLLAIVLISLLLIQTFNKPPRTRRKLKYSVSSLKRSVTDDLDDKEEI
ncbi:MAG: hypothetical protein AABX11_05285 [Nanoarchaeota archaeon]|mgnify:CR=1 FL=1